MHHGLDLLLINPGGRSKIYQQLGADLAAVEPPVWAGLIATFVRRHGFAVDIIDADAEELGPDEVAKRTLDMHPLLTAVVVYGHQPSATTQTMPAASAICQAIKEGAPDLKVLLVGGHAAALPERTLQEETADFVCGDEGPHTLLDLIQAMKGTAAPDYSKVRGLWYWDGKETRNTTPAPLVTDLDTGLPGLAWDLLPMEAYRAHNWHCFGNLDRQPYASLYTTLGCPYHCSFCCIQAPYKSGERALGAKESVNSYRYWSPEAVADQLDTLVNRYGVRNVKIADEMFVLNPRHVLGICDLVIERGYDLNIWAYARIDTVRDEMVDKLRQAGFRWLAFGVESGSERVRANVEKRFDQDEIYRTIEKVRGAGISVIANYIFGLPEDDLESMQETLDLAQDLNCEFANFYCAMAYPGSQLYQTALREGLPLPAKWSGYSQHGVDSQPLPTKYVSTADVVRFRDHAFQAYFTHPTYLNMIGQKFGPETVAHIREMTSHTLVRQYA